MKGAWLGIVAACCACAGVEERDTQQQTLPGIRVVEVDNILGSIHVTGVAGSEFKLVANRRISAEDRNGLEQAKREVKLDVSSNGGVAKLYVDGPFRCNCKEGWRGRDYQVRYDFELQTPMDAELRLRTVNDGDIIVKGVRGRFQVNHVNGPIEMTGLGAEGVARTVNGQVRLAFAQQPAGPVQAKTVNGEIAATFPKSANAKLSFRTLHGEVYTDFPFTAAAGEPMQGEKNGNRRVYRRRWNSAVQIGSGGPAHQFETVNGDIRILEEKR